MLQGKILKLLFKLLRKSFLLLLYDKNEIIIIHVIVDALWLQRCQRIKISKTLKLSMTNVLLNVKYNKALKPVKHTMSSSLKRVATAYFYEGWG